jgi:Ribosome biogenesis protein Nop16
MECLIMIIDGKLAMALSSSYAALGLAVSLNPRASGGAERSASVTEARTVEDGATFINDSDPPSLTSGRNERALPNSLAKGLGRIVRDEAGRIIAVETNCDADPSPPTTYGLDLVEAAAATAAVLTPESQSWVLLGRTSGAEKPKTELIRGVYGNPGASGDNRFDLTCLGIFFCRCLN